MASLGRRRGSSAMVDSPRNTASVFSACSSLDLLPPAGDADPWLHRSWSLSPRPHRSVCRGSLQPERRYRSGWPGTAASGSGVRPHPTSSLVYLRYKNLHQQLGPGAGSKYGNVGKDYPHAHEVKVLRGK